MRSTGICTTIATWRCRKICSQCECVSHWKLRCYWLKFLRQCQITVVIQGLCVTKSLHCVYYVSFISVINKFISLLRYISLSNANKRSYFKNVLRKNLQIKKYSISYTQNLSQTKNTSQQNIPHRWPVKLSYWQWDLIDNSKSISCKWVSNFSSTKRIVKT